jgi:ABC-type transport system involved in multi-copper enzyme maturation permease subunit
MRRGASAKIAKYVFVDEIRQKSFIAIFAACVVGLFLSRGCYRGDFVVNGQPLVPSIVVTMVSGAAFHIISVVMMLLAALLAVRLLKHDRDGGVQSSVLSKPITRRQYLLGKAGGLWSLLFVFMIVLHIIVFLVAALSGKVLMAGYLVAALFSSLNLLFAILVVLLLSLLMSETAALLCFIAIGVLGFFFDGTGALGGQITTVGDISLWTVLSYAWPKLSGMERFASSFISGSGLHGFRSVYPLLNILAYCLVSALLLAWRFEREEIA